MRLQLTAPRVSGSTTSFLRRTLSAVFSRTALSASLFSVAVICALFVGVAAAEEQPGEKFPAVFNTEGEGQHPPTAEEMVRMIELPKGFHVTLFASEPDVQQPICMDFDDRGRLWVAENYTYSGGPYEKKLRDRIVILEDKDGDGRHDSRKVFWDQGFMLTSLTWGFGGLWILHDGTLSFIPDRNGDDIPDSEPVVQLDGWSKDCGHNFVSGLIWGPDGWLYGRHGIVDTSRPGIPGTPTQDRPVMNCGIWRYHPVTRQIEVVCHGTTNPWGLDYNEDCQFFMTNNVQGHLWHIIPGARFQRMYGQDFNPFSFELMEMTADHYHWDTKMKWTDSRDGKANDLGGGHSHVGALIYHGDQFPKEYRGKIFMCNTHGRRINVNRLDREGSGYVGRSEPDFMLVKNPWFRGVDIKMGPEGSMYVADWSDNGECHDHDGIHRTSGRIYRISYGDGKTNAAAAINALKDPSAHRSRSDWAGRHARRILQERAAAGERVDDSPSFTPLSSVQAFLFHAAIGRLTQKNIMDALKSQDEVLRAQAVQLAANTASADAAQRTSLLSAIRSMASQPQSASVLMALMSVLQKLPHGDRTDLLLDTFSCKDNVTTVAADNKLTLMAWYGMEPVASADSLLPRLDQSPKLQSFIVRRRAHEIEKHPDTAGKTLSWIAERSATEPAAAAALLTAFRSGLAGRARVPAPPEWKTMEEQLRKSEDAALRQTVDSLAALFGDGAALADLRALAGNASEDPVAREYAVNALAQARDAESLPMFYNLLGDRAIYGTVIRALADFDQPGVPAEILARISGFRDGNRSVAIDTLSVRKSSALALMDALESGRITADEISASQVRQLLAFGDDRIRSVLESKWGIVQETSESRAKAMEHWKQTLTPAELSKANLDAGAELFRKSCASCHRLYAEGKTIGPDLTGANRSNLEYLLINIIDPSSVVPKQFTTSVVNLQDGRVITGVIVSETEQTLVIQTDKEQLTVERSAVEESKNTGRSLMPDGLLDPLKPEQVRDLFGFIMFRK